MGARRSYEVTPQIDADGIAQSQTPASGGVQDFILNGVFVTDGVGSFTDSAHIIEFVQAADETGRTFTVFGTDSRDVSISEEVSGSTGTVSTTKHFKTVSQITTDDNTAGAITIGVSGLCVSPWVLMNQGEIINIGFIAELSSGASLTYSVEHTFADLQINSDIEIVTLDSAVSGETATANDNYAFPATGFRLKTTAFTSGTIVFTTWSSY
jgi:hypothetical protein